MPVPQGQGHATIVLLACNFTPVPRHNYRVGVPAPRTLEGDPQRRRAALRRQRPGQHRRSLHHPGRLARTASLLELVLPPLGMIVLKWTGKKS